MSRIVNTAAIGALLGATLALSPAQAEPATYHHAQVQGLDIFYREAGPKTAPTFFVPPDWKTKSMKRMTIVIGRM